MACQKGIMGLVLGGPVSFMASLTEQWIPENTDTITAQLL